jgi:hypothetical protein
MTSPNFSSQPFTQLRTMSQDVAVHGLKAPRIDVTREMLVEQG